MASKLWFQRKSLQYGVSAPIIVGVFIAAGHTTLGLILTLAVVAVAGVVYGLAEDEIS